MTGAHEPCTPHGRPGFSTRAFLAAALVLAGACVAGAARGADLVPPLDIPPVLTSSFGEYRGGHYHAGLDYSTGGREGLPVHAPAAGVVVRVRASGVGYGRAVYFRLHDGRVAVFAHLSRFDKRLEERVRAEQDRLSRYEIDLEPGPPALEYEAGDVLAYTGSSGAGPPHLHVELRRGPETAVAWNPLCEGWSVPDGVAPRLSRVRIEPRKAGARVDGGTEPVVVDRAQASRGPLAIAGPVRVWIETHDLASAGGNRLAPHRVEWWIEDRLVSVVDLTRTDWRWPREVEWTFENALARRGERWVCLDPPPRSRQEVARWMSSPPDDPGPQRWSFRSLDVAGNVSTLDVSVRLTSSPPDRGGAPGVRSRGATLLCRLAAPATGAPDALRALSPGGMIHHLRGAPEPATVLYEIETPPGAEAGLWRFEGAGPQNAWTAVWTDTASASRTVDLDGARLTFGPETRFEPGWITVRWDDLPTAEGDLAPVTGILRLGPWAAPLRESAALVFAPPAGSRRGLAVYRREGTGWSFVGADTSGAGVAAELSNLEDTALFRDVTPPRIAIHVTSAGPRPTLTARISDGGAGVTPRALTMRLDGEPLIAEWDPDAGRLRAHLRRDVTAGAHELVVVAEDRVGNRETAARTFRIP